MCNSAELGANRFEPVTEVANDGGVPQNRVLTLNQVVAGHGQQTLPAITIRTSTTAHLQPSWKSAQARMTLKEFRTERGQ